MTKLAKTSNIFVTDVVLRELDGNKKAEGPKGYNAREFFRQFNKSSFTKLETLPGSGKAVLENDTLTAGSIDSGAHVYTLSRKRYRVKDINDSRIIEMAKDYELELMTLDQAQSARAKTISCSASLFRHFDQGQLKGDVFVVISLIFFVFTLFLVMATESVLEGNILVAIFSALIAIFVYMALVNKILAAKSNGGMKVISFLSFTVAAILFIFAEVNDSFSSAVIGFVFSVLGAIVSSFSRIHFKWLSARYHSSNQKQPDDLELESDIGDSVINTSISNIGGAYGQSGTIYRL